MMTAPLGEDEIRAAAMVWLQQVTLGGVLPVTRDQLANDFIIGGQRFPLVDRGRGIRRPRGWNAALSMTAAPKPGKDRPYDDVEGEDGLHRYKFRRDARGHGENDSLRVALRDQVPVIWLVGLQAGLFEPIFPTYLAHEEPELDQFALSPTPTYAELAAGSPVESELRRYLVAQRSVRLHQAKFASTIMRCHQPEPTPWAAMKPLASRIPCRIGDLASSRELRMTPNSLRENPRQQ